MQYEKQSVLPHRLSQKRFVKSDHPLIRARPIIQPRQAQIKDRGNRIGILQKVHKITRIERGVQNPIRYAKKEYKLGIFEGSIKNETDASLRP